MEKYVRKEVIGTNLSDDDIKFVTYFYSNSMIGNTFRWLQHGMQDSQEQLIYKMSVSYQATIKALIAQIEKDKSKN